MDKQLKYIEYSNEKELEISDSISAIDEYTFMNCENIYYVQLPTSIVKICDGAFYGCSNLKRIIMPNSITTVGDCVFENCPQLKVVKLSEKLSNISDHLFSGCKSIINLDIPYSVESIGDEAFYNCSSLSSITIPYTITKIGAYAFFGCNGIITFDTPESLTDFGESALSFCDELETVNIDSKKLTYLPSNLCTHDSSLTKVYVTSPIKTIESQAFYECRNLKEIVLPQSLVNGTIKKLAFGNCISLEKIIFNGTRDEWLSIPKEDDWDKNVPASMIVICKGDLTEWIYPVNSNTFTENLYGTLEYREDRTSAEIIKLGASIFSLGERAFYNYENLTELYISKHLTFIDAFAFLGCSNLKTIHYDGTIEQWNAINKYVATSVVNPDVHYYEWKENASANYATTSNYGQFTVKCSDGDILEEINSYYKIYETIDEKLLWVIETTKNSDEANNFEPNSLENNILDGYTYITTTRSNDCTTFIYNKSSETTQYVEENNYLSSISKPTYEYLYSFNDLPDNTILLTDAQLATANFILNNMIVTYDNIYVYEYVFKLVHYLFDNSYKMICTKITRLNNADSVVNGGYYIEKYTTVYDNKDIKPVDAVYKEDIDWIVTEDAKAIECDEHSFTIEDLQKLRNIHTIRYDIVSTMYRYIIPVIHNNVDLSHYIKYTTIDGKETLPNTINVWTNDIKIIKNKYE